MTTEISVMYGSEKVKLIYLNQVVEKYSYLFNFKPDIC